jgi:hypothetical protein
MSRKAAVIGAGLAVASFVAWIVTKKAKTKVR